jgi:nitroreductase
MDGNQLVPQFHLWMGTSYYESFMGRRIAMDVLEAIKTRKSIRAYKKDPVPKELLAKILEAAIWAPSGSNVQPWEFTVLQGKDKELLVEAILKAASKLNLASQSYEAPAEGLKRREELFSIFTAKAAELGGNIEKLLYEGSFSFYDAPVVIIVTTKKAYGTGRLADIGAAIQNLLLAAHKEGLGTCWIGIILAVEKAIKEHLKIPEDKRVVAGIAVGYPDLESPFNQFRSSRENLDKFVRWSGF